MKKYYKSILFISSFFFIFPISYAYSQNKPGGYTQKSTPTTSNVSSSFEELDNVPSSLLPTKRSSKTIPNDAHEEIQHSFLDDFYFKILVAFSSLLSFIISIFLLLSNLKNRRLIDQLTYSLKKKISLNTFNDETKKNLEKLDNKFNNFVRIKDITSINEKLEALEKRLENSSKHKSIDFEKSYLDNDIPNYSSRVMDRIKMEIKPKTFEEDLIEKFNNMQFRDFHEENNGKRVAITNSQDILVNNSIEPNLKDQEQGKYCVIPFEEQNNNFYLFPTKSDDIKIDENSKKIFKFTRGTENGTYSSWGINKPAIVHFDTDSYKVIENGKIDILGN